MNHFIEGKNDLEYDEIINKSKLDWLGVVLNSVTCGVIIFNRWNESKFVVNNEFLKIFDSIDYSPSEKKGILRKEDLKKIDLYRSKGEKLSYEDFPLLKSIDGENVKDFELIIKDKVKGSEKLIIINSLPIYDQSGNIMAAIATISDITEFKRTENDLIKVTKGKKVLSQDFNDRVLNILNCMVNIFELNEHPDLKNKDTAKINPNILNVNLLNFIHELLFNFPDLENVEIREYLQFNFSEISAIYPEEIDLKVYGHASMTMDMLMSCGLIINDIITYRLRSYQVNRNINDIIESRFRKVQNEEMFKLWIQLNNNQGKTSIKITDNGPKLPFWAENKIETILKLTYQLMEQFSGFMKINSNSHTTSFVLEFLHPEI